MEAFYLILGIIIAYLLGSVPSAVWVGKTFYSVDVRTQGSGNAGATNTIRVLGVRAGIPVLLFDIFKGWLAVFLSHYFIPVDFSTDNFIIYEIIVATVVVLGHVFPLFAGFRGGKGIATLLGVGIAIYPIEVLIVIAIFIIVLVAFKYVSLASITASVCFPLIVIFVFNQSALPLILLAVFVGIFVPITHHKNIKRLLKGTESKFTLKKKQKSTN
jgi:glycerol-3-phosphate acyltransferase PlsY